MTGHPKLTVQDFEGFFEELNGFTPFAWQTRVLESLAATGRWPEAVSAPTGTGKSALVEVHVFANALFAVGAIPRVPRRYVTVVNRRSLTDSAFDRAERISRHLKEATGGISQQVQEALVSLAPHHGPASSLSTAGVQTVNLRGGLCQGREWIADPRVCTVIAATPDMYGSRVLFRGYGTSRLARPRDAGLLAMDVVVVQDEAHLNQQLTSTLHGIARLCASAKHGIGIPFLQVVETTATPDTRHDASTMTGVTLEDIANEPLLESRVATAKPLRYVRCKEAPEGRKPSKAYVRQLVDQAVQLSQETSTTSGNNSSTVAIVVNTVRTALLVDEECKRRFAKDDVTTVTWVGRMRPMDLQRAKGDYPGLFSLSGDSSVDFLIATQTVEVGVDMDWAGLVTELCPPASLAQRVGRVNRSGSRASGPVVVVGPVDEPSKDALPYVCDDLVLGYEWSQALAESPWGAATMTWLDNTSLVPSLTAPNRWGLSDISGSEAEMLAHTTVPLFAEFELEFWLRDSLEKDDAQVGLALRGPLPTDGTETALLQATPLDDREIFPAEIGKARQVLVGLEEQVTAGKIDKMPVWLWREGELSSRVLNGTGETVRDLRPGDVVVVPETTRIAVAGVVNENLDDNRSHRSVWGAPGVLVVRAVVNDDGGVSSVVYRDPGTPSGPSWCTELLTATEDMTPEEVQAYVDERAPGAYTVSVAPEASRDEYSGQLPWVVMQPTELNSNDAQVAQTWTPSRSRVLLESHSAAVAKRAEKLALDLDLDAVVVAALKTAGQFHDAGKADRRFQQGTLGNMSEDVLAKSSSRTPQAISRRATSTLPRGWRHEQLSAAYALVELADGVSESIDTELAVRLTGTSHGHGRPFFPHGVETLLDEGESELVKEAASALYGEDGRWFSLVRSTDLEWGWWAIAYLESVLRAADGQVSAEGS